MRTTEHDAKKTPSAETGFFAVLVDLRRVRGIGAPPAARRLALGWLLAASATLVLSAAPAFAVQTHLLLSTFNASDAPAGAVHPIADPSAIAVDNSSNFETAGDVYVADAEGHNVVDRFDASGEYRSQLNGSGTVQKSLSQRPIVAVDQSDGDVYVCDTGHRVIDKFKPSALGLEEVETAFGTGGEISAASIKAGEPGSPGVGSQFLPRGLAVDPSSGDLYVGDKANDVIDVFDSSGKYVRQFPTSGEPGLLAI